MDELRKQPRQQNGATADTLASSPNYAMGLLCIAGDWGTNMAKVVNG
jgi:hypothetical protein